MKRYIYNKPLKVNGILAKYFKALLIKMYILYEERDKNKQLLNVNVFDYSNFYNTT